MKNETEWKWCRKQLDGICRTNQKEGLNKIYLFLDFDGVINVFREPGTPEYKKAYKDGEFQFTDDDVIANLQSLCDTYPIYAILSSSWRYAGIPYCEEYVHKAGMHSSFHFYGMTDTDAFGLREEEIVTWLFEHPDFTNFIILDDMFMPHLVDHLVHTDPCCGFDSDCLKQAERILQR